MLSLGERVQQLLRYLIDIGVQSSCCTELLVQTIIPAPRQKRSTHRGALRPCGARPKAAPMLSLFNVVVLCLRMHTLRAIIRVLCTLGVICVLFHHSHIHTYIPNFLIGGVVSVA